MVDAMVVALMMLMRDGIERPVEVLLAIVLVLLVVPDSVPTVDPVVRVLVGVLAKVDAGCLIRPHTLLLVDVDSGA